MMKKVVLYLGSLFAVALLGEDAREVLAGASRPFFAENKGQWPEEVLFLTRIGGMDAWITTRGVVYDFYRLKPRERDISSRIAAVAPTGPDEEAMPRQRYGHVVRMELEGAASEPQGEGLGRQPGYHNYFLGNDPRKWASFVPLYRAVRVKGVYPGVDIRYYFEQGLVRYDFEVSPGADVAAIRFRMRGAESVWVTTEGALAFRTRFGNVRYARLLAYQESNAGREVIPCTFRVDRSGTVRFRVDDYDPSRPLVIDPLVYSTFIGKGGHEYAYDVTIDNARNAYLTGTVMSTDYPTTTGAYDTGHNGNWDAFVTKLNSTADSLIYSTFIGGTQHDEAKALALDASGNVYVAGGTRSPHYPTTANAYDTSFNGGSDLFVLKLNGTGSALIYSTFIGGNTWDDANAMALGATGKVYVTGRTYSTDYPVTSGAYDTLPYYNTYDVMVTALNGTGSALVFSTFLGGSGSDAGVAIAVDGSDNVYVAGNTDGSDYPVTTGAYDPSHNGGADVFLTKLNSTGAALLYSTFLGGTSYDNAASLAIDASGNAYLTGTTESANYPTTSAAFDTSHNGNKDVFVTKLDNTGATLVYSTFIGGNADEKGHALFPGSKGEIYVTGYVQSADYPTTMGAYDTTLNNTANYLTDVFISRLNDAGSALTYSTFLGGSASEYGYSLVVDGFHVYVAGITRSSNYPTTTGAYDATHNGNWDVFLTKLSLMGPTVLRADVPSSLDAWMADGWLMVKAGGKGRVALVDGWGRKLWTRTVAAGLHRFPMHHLPPGAYVVEVTTGMGAVRRRRLVLP